jgi:hypothetical protein
MRKIFSAISAFIILNAAHSQDATNAFKAPGIARPFYAPGSPFGMTEKGFCFGLGFNLTDGSESGVSFFWVSAGAERPLPVDSISAVNRVSLDLRLPISGGSLTYFSVALKPFYKLQCRLTRTNGPSPLSLYFENTKDLESVIYRLKTSGLDSEICDLLKKLGQETVIDVNTERNQWRFSWCEIDASGGIERVTLLGTTQPLRQHSILREVLFDSGHVPQQFLKRDIYFDIGLAR